MTTAALAKFASELRYEDLPSEVVEQAKNAIQDFFGISLYVSRNTPWGKTIAEFAASETNGKGDSTIIGWGTKTIPSKAALANGTMALGYEYEDVHIASTSHPHSAVISAPLAVGEKLKTSGRDLITAIVIGYEVMGRVGIASGKSLGPATLGRGLYPTQLYGVFGAAAAVGRLLGLDTEKMAMAMGLAGEQAAGTMQSHAEGAWSRRWHGGKAAESGITAALLAQRGFVGPKQILEGQYGLYKAFALDFEPDKLTEGLGRSWEIMNIWFKSHACCGAWHTTLDALLALRREHNIDPGQVTKIEGYLRELTTLHARKDFPTIIAAQYSMPFCLAAAMLRGRMSPAEFTEETIRDPIIAKFALEKVETFFDEGLKQKGLAVRSMPSRVVVKMKDGREYTNEAIFPKGHPGNPMTVKEMRTKFEDLANSVLTKAQTAELYNAIRGIDKVKDVSTLSRLFSPTS